MSKAKFNGITKAEILILQYCGKAKTRQEIKAVFPGSGQRLGGLIYVLNGWLKKGWIHQIHYEPAMYVANPKILEMEVNEDEFGQFEKDVKEMIDSAKYHIV